MNKIISHHILSQYQENIIALRMEHGWAGYGLYWAIIERLSTNNNTLSLQYNILAYDLRTTEEDIKSIIENFGLFHIEEDCFHSPIVIEDNANLPTMEVKINPNSSIAGLAAKEKTTQKKAKPKAAPKTKPIEPALPIKVEKLPKKFTPPTEEEAQEYINANGYNQHLTGQEFCDFYASKGWVVGKSPMKDWHRAIGSWVGRKKRETPQLNKLTQLQRQEYENYERHHQNILLMQELEQEGRNNDSDFYKSIGIDV